ncbi:MAG: flagellar motor switch protein FliN [candidate division Zixibacteria bacterium]|nr:flagellar motor switch protein FliN [candidate division Zixibacteria bacterium]
MADEQDEQNNAEGATPVPPPDDDLTATPGLQPVTETTPAAAIPPLGTEAIADVFSDVAALRAEEASGTPTQVIKEPTMAFASAMPQADDPMLVHPAEFPQLTGGAAPHAAGNIDLLLDVKLPVSIELGRTVLPISDILNWAQGTVVELDKLAGEPVNLLVNNKLVARGEVVVVDENFGLRITALVSPKERIESL